MVFEQRSLDDYVDVAQRITAFRDMYPEGSLRPWNPAEPFRLVQAEGWEKGATAPIQQTFLVVVAAAYRHGLDDNPGVGMAWEIFPGRTPYTRGSELQNAETSAWGRAIIAVGASDSKRGIASREEVRNRQAERDDGLPVNRDGSLSRSRTTDEQKDAAGLMTDAQQRAHNKLRRDGEPDPQRVEKLSTTPADDPWYTDVVEEVLEVTEHTRERAKSAGWIISEAFARLQVFDRAERLKQTGEIVGRDIESSKDLTPMEVGIVLEALQKREVPA